MRRHLIGLCIAVVCSVASVSTTDGNVTTATAVPSIASGSALSAPSLNGAYRAAVPSASEVVVLPWEDESAYFIYYCGNVCSQDNKDTESCYLECIDYMGCDGVVDWFNPLCYAAAAGCCLGCGGPSPGCDLL